MISVFVDFFNFIGSFINFILNLSYYIGKLLVAIGAWTYEALKTLSFNFCSLCVILYEDFSYFSSDIWTFIEAIGTTINNGLKSVIDGIVYGSVKTYDTFVKIISDGGSRLNNFYTAIYDLSAFILLSLKNFVILLGNGSWFLITLIPKFLMTCSVICWKGCLDLWNHIREACKITSNRITIATKTAYNYFIDVPLHCALGLLVLYITFRMRHKIIRTVRVTLQHIWNLVQHYNHQFRLYRIRRQNNQRLQQNNRQGEQEIDLLMTNEPPLFATSPSNGPSARKPLRRSTRQVENGKKNESPTSNTLACVICLDKKKTVVCLPCRHLCLCKNCSQQLTNFQQNSCPLCRNHITEMIDTYI